MRRESCDIEEAQGELRMCWHAGDGRVLRSGYRCGATILNGDNGWERLVYTRSRGVELGPLRGVGHHGSCDTFNACGGARTCANALCALEGHGEAISWEEGLCQEVARERPGFRCELFRALPDSLDRGWNNGCNIPVAYDIVCSE